jgi:hypothetical protein
MPDKILEKLKTMEHKTWMYRTDTFRIIDFEIGEHHLVIITESGYRKVPIKKAMDFLNDCLPVANEPMLPVKHEREILKIEENSTFKDVNNILMENIKRVQEDPAYVNQAKVVNSSVQTMLTMVKHKIEVAKMTNKREL